MIVPRAIAQDGYGYGALSIAASGYLAGGAAPAPQPQPGGVAGFRARKARGERVDDWIAGEALGEALTQARAGLLVAAAGQAAGEASTFGRLSVLSIAVGRALGAADARALAGEHYRFAQARAEDDAWWINPKGDA